MPQSSSFLTEHLASYGFVVAAPPHPGNTVYDGAAYCFAQEHVLDSFVERTGDVEAAVDGMLHATDEAGDLFAGAIDGERIGVLGHSFGGQTVLRIGATDLRVRAVLALAPLAGPAVLHLAERIAVPTMIQGGELDSQTPFVENQQTFFDRIPAERYLVEIFRTGHFAFSNLCASSSNPNGSNFPECAAGNLTQEEAHAFVIRFAVPFLTLHVGGDDRFAALLDPASAPAGTHLDMAAAR